MTVEINTTRDFVAIIDDEDAYLGSFNWHALVSEQGNCTSVARSVWLFDGKRQRTASLHCTVFERALGRELLHGELVDHIDGNPLNNRRGNLRLATRAQNAQNSKRYRSNQSGYKGVCWHKQRKRWQATISVNGKLRYLGLFDTPEAAYAAYCTAAKEYHGEFARLD